MMTAQDLIALRKRLGLSREEFAKAIGVTYKSVYNWELARTAFNPYKNTVDNIQKLSDEAKAKEQLIHDIQSEGL